MLVTILVIVAALCVVSLSISALGGAMDERALRRLNPARMAERQAEWQRARWFWLIAGLIVVFCALAPR